MPGSLIVPRGTGACPEGLSDSVRKHVWNRNRSHWPGQIGWPSNLGGGGRTLGSPVATGPLQQMPAQSHPRRTPSPAATPAAPRGRIPLGVGLACGPCLQVIDSPGTCEAQLGPGPCKPFLTWLHFTRPKGVAFALWLRSALHPQARGPMFLSDPSSLPCDCQTPSSPLGSEGLWPGPSAPHTSSGQRTAGQDQHLQNAQGHP